MSWSAPEDWSRWDPDKLMVCPYDETHMIKAKRFQYHLLKCRQNHPEKDLVTCPFNAKHKLLRHDIRHHVSRCPDRSVIEHYNYKGSEKDEDGFYFKGNTSVPSYHRTDDLQEPSESWDSHDEERNLQRSVHNNTDRSRCQQGSPQSSTTVTDTLSLSPEEREKFKRQLRREAVVKSSNSGIQLPSRMCSTSQGYNTNLDVHRQQYSPTSNPVFQHCVEQGAISSLSQQQGRNNSNFAPTGAIRCSAPKQNNPIFQYCIEKMQGEPQQGRVPSTVSEASNEQYKAQLNIVVKSRGANNSFHSQHTSEKPPLSPTDANPEFRSSFIESEMKNRLKLVEREKPELTAISNVCGHPTSPTCTGVNSPQLAGVGRARLHAEARRNNFGGICYNTPRPTGIEPSRTPPGGRGRGLLNFMYSS
ncbi:hypothetical protein ACROYT_G032504 [Oculina patagonica]